MPLLTTQHTEHRSARPDVARRRWGLTTAAEGAMVRTGDRPVCFACSGSSPSLPPPHPTHHQHQTTPPNTYRPTTTTPPRRYSSSSSTPSSCSSASSQARPPAAAAPAPSPPSRPSSAAAPSSRASSRAARSGPSAAATVASWSRTARRRCAGGSQFHRSWNCILCTVSVGVCIHMASTDCPC